MDESKKSSALQRKRKQRPISTAKDMKMKVLKKEELKEDRGQASNFEVFCTSEKTAKYHEISMETDRYCSFTNYYCGQCFHKTTETTSTCQFKSYNSWQYICRARFQFIEIAPSLDLSCLSSSISVSFLALLLSLIIKGGRDDDNIQWAFLHYTHIFDHSVAPQGDKAVLCDVNVWS